MVFSAFFNEGERQIAASSVESMVRRILDHLKLDMDKCVWSFAAGRHPSMPHRLDICAAGIAVKTYISDNELASCCYKRDTTTLENRLFQLLSGIRDLVEDMAWNELPKHCWTTAKQDVALRSAKKSSSRK